MKTHRIDRALQRAREELELGPHSAPENRLPRRVQVAMGDPQADVLKVLAVLEHQGLLGENGRLRDDVHLVSVGDHFDWGGPLERERVTLSGTLLLAWLAGHPADQVTLLAGNHDLARVGELALFDDVTYRRIREEADRVYRSEDADQEATFIARHPEVPSSEVLARDFSAFDERQRKWVEHLLRVKRLRLAFAHGEMLLSHAGVTVDELRGRVDESATPAEIAQALNAALDAAVDAWTDGPLHLTGLHRPGSGVYGEGVGMLFHRPSIRADDAFERGISPPRRRFDPRRLPRGLTQVVGHIRDEKCLALLGGNPREAWDGVLRHLWTDGLEVHYTHGTGEKPSREEAAMIFLDGSMRNCPIAEYELLDLDRRVALAS